MDNTTALLHRAQRLNAQATAQLERSQQLQQIPLLRPHSPVKAIPLFPWRVVLAMAAAFGLSALAAWLGCSA